MRKPLISAWLCTATLSVGLINPVHAALLNPDEGYAHFENKVTTLDEQIRQIDSELAMLNHKMYWGYFPDGGDGTWLPMWGFIFPGITQLILGLDPRAPGWLRTTSWLQLLALSVGGVGLTFALEPSLAEQLDREQRQLVTGATFGGAAAYAALGIIPSAIVGAHDGATALGIDEKKKQLQTKGTLLKNQLDEYTIAKKFYLSYKNKYYSYAIELAQDKSWTSTEFRPDNLDINHLKGLDLKEKLNEYKIKIENHNFKDAFNLGEEILDLEIIDQYPSEKAYLENEQINTEQKMVIQFEKEEEERAKLEAEEHARKQKEELEERTLKENEERENLLKEAYRLANKQEYREAYDTLEKYDWSIKHPQYQTVQKKLKDWNYILYSNLYKRAYNAAGSGDVTTAVSILKDYVNNWPKDHPDAKRVRQKYKEWLTIHQKRNKIIASRGYLNDGQMRILKNLSLHPIIPTYFPPSTSGWNFTTSAARDDSYYKIVYYDEATNTSYAIIGSRAPSDEICGNTYENIPLFDQAIGRYMLKGTSEFVSTSVGNIGITAVPFADAYITKKVGSIFCYVLVTPATASANVAYGMNVPRTTKRVSKEEFKKIVKSVKYLP